VSSPLPFQPSTLVPDQRRHGTSRRITRGRDLEHVWRRGQELRFPSLTARVVASSPDDNRVGLIVPRFGNSAVDRNRLKRRLRELVRLRILSGFRGYHVVIRTRRNAYAATFRKLESEITELASRLNQ
jgi:ribonuclease P protein component